MDQFTRQIIDEAIALADAADKFCARRGEFDDVLQQRSDATTLIYKVHNNAQTDNARVTPQPTNAWSDWDAWCDARIDKMFEESFVPAISEFAVLYVRKRLNAETAKLYGQIADLKVEVAALKSEVKTLRSADNVVPMKGRDHAA